MSGNCISNTFKSAMSYSFKKNNGYVGDEKFMYGKGSKEHASEPKIISFKFVNEDKLPGPRTKELIVNSETLQEVHFVANEGVIIGSIGDEAARETGMRPGDRLIEIDGICVVSFSLEKIYELIERELRNASKLKLTLREKELLQM